MTHDTARGCLLTNRPCIFRKPFRYVYFYYNLLFLHGLFSPSNMVAHRWRYLCRSRRWTLRRPPENTVASRTCSSSWLFSCSVSRALCSLQHLLLSCVPRFACSTAISRSRKKPNILIFSCH